MENLLLKFLNKSWWVGGRPEIALAILKQISVDIRDHIGQVVSTEISNLSLYPCRNQIRRSWSMPILGHDGYPSRT